MRTPIEVIGKDAVSYPGKDIFMHIESSQIVAAYPCYTVKTEDGSYWRCVPESDGAELTSYALKYFDGTIYRCSDEQELSKIGLSLSKSNKKRTIGFISGEKGEKIPQEIKI